MSYLEGNAYHEAGHAIVAWALGKCVHEITIRDDKPGENARIAGVETLSLLDQIALLNADRQAEEIFDHLLPLWASRCDRVGTIKLLAANEIRETPEAEKWIADGRARPHATVGTRRRKSTRWRRV
jgi:hypothetical protein